MVTTPIDHHESGTTATWPELENGLALQREIRHFPNDILEDRAFLALPIRSWKANLFVAGKALIGRVLFEVFESQFHDGMRFQLGAGLSSIEDGKVSDIKRELPGIAISGKGGRLVCSKTKLISSRVQRNC